MTTPQQKIFNPNLFKDPNQEERSQAQQVQKEQKEYPVTGNASRDSVRKFIYESFQGDADLNQAEKYTIAQVVELKNAKTLNLKNTGKKVAKCRLRQKYSLIYEQFYKGPRFEQSRKDLRAGAIDAKTFIRDDYVQGKSVAQVSTQSQVQQQIPGQINSAVLSGGGITGMPPGGVGFRPPGPGGMIRPRMMGPGGTLPMYRPPMGAIGRPPVPLNQPLPQTPIQNTNNNQPSRKQSSNESENKSHSQEIKKEDSLSQDKNISIGGMQIQDTPKSQQSIGKHEFGIQQIADQQQQQMNLPRKDSNRSITSASLNNQQERNLDQTHKEQESDINNQSQQLLQPPVQSQRQNIASDRFFEEERNQDSSSITARAHLAAKHDDSQQHHSAQIQNHQNLQSHDVSVDFSVEKEEGGAAHAKKKGKKKKKKAAKKATGPSASFIGDKGGASEFHDQSSIIENENQNLHSQPIGSALQENLIQESLEQQIDQQHQEQQDLVNLKDNKVLNEQEIHLSTQDINLASQNQQYQQPETIELQQRLEHNQQEEEQSKLIHEFQQRPAHYQFLDESQSVSIQHQKEDFQEEIQQNQQQEQSLIQEQLLHQNEEEEKHQNLQHQSLKKIETQNPNLDSNLIPDDRSLQDSQNLKRKKPLMSQKDDREEENIHSQNLVKPQEIIPTKSNKPLSVKSMTQSSQQQTINNNEIEGIKRLQDALSYKRAQKKELTEKLTHVENDCHLQQKKASMLMEENKQLREELRQKDRELKHRGQNNSDQINQLEARNKQLENQVSQKQSEIDQLKREVQRLKEEKQTYKERINQMMEETQQQRQFLDNFLRSLESRIQNQNLGQMQSFIASSSGDCAVSSNQQDQIENVQKEMREMRTYYEQKIRELNEDLQNKTKILQRTERQNLQLQEKNIQLNEVLSQVEIQQLSTVAGSGSNQREAIFNRRVGLNDDGQQDMLHNYQYEGAEEEGTGGDRGYNQMIQPSRNQDYNFIADEGGNAPVVGGMINDNFEDENYLNTDETSNQRQNRQSQNYQAEAVGGGHPQFEEEGEPEDDDEEDDEDYDDDDGDMLNGGEEEDEDEEGNQFDDNSQGIASQFNQQQQRDSQNLGQTHQQQNIMGFQEENEGYAGGQQTHSHNRQRKQGQRNKRGNRQQNQQHTNTTSSNLQNPRQRNSRGRQQRSNQQHVQQQQQLQSLSQQEQINAPPSSQVAQNQMRQTQNSISDYFQSYGDSSSLFTSNQNRDQSSSINITYQQNQISQREGGGVAGPGVVLTAGRTNNPQSTIDSMMSAESGSTATAFFDKNQFHRGLNVPQIRQQNQTSSLHSTQQQQFQTGSNNNQINQQQQNYPNISNDLFNDSDSYTAAVGAPTSRAAAHPRQQRQPNLNQQMYGGYQFNEEVKQSSGDIPTYFGMNSNNQQMQSYSQSRVGQIHNQYVGGSGEQEEDSGIFSSGGAIASQINQHYHGHGGAGAPFDQSKRNQSSVQQIRPNLIQQQHQDQSNTPTRNVKQNVLIFQDSRKTSGANTPNKDGADTPTTKAYRGQQQQNSYVHNLTTNQLFFSNQDEGDTSNIFNQQHQQQQNSTPYIRDLDVISGNMFE